MPPEINEDDLVGIDLSDLSGLEPPRRSISRAIHEWLVGEPPEAKPWGPGLSVLWTVLGVIASFVVTFIFGIFAGSTIAVSPGRSTEAQLELDRLLSSLELSGAMLFQSTLLLAVLFFARLRPVSFRDYFALSRPRPKAIGLGALAIVLWVGMQAIIVIDFDLETPETFSRLATIQGALPILLVLAVVVAPVVEELTFRGFLWRGLIDSKAGLHGTVVVTTLIWTMLHVGEYGLVYLSMVFTSGLILGYARHLSGNLWVPMLMHAANNLIAWLGLALSSHLGQI